MTRIADRIAEHDEEVRRRHRLGDTYEEIADWLKTRGCETSTTSVWRYLNSPVKLPRRNRRHEGWLAKRKAGATLEEIAKAAGVSKQAVSEALRKYDGEETVAP